MSMAELNQPGSSLVHAGVTYEDMRVEGAVEGEVLYTTPAGQLPEGVVLTGCRPIAQFLAERFGLAGSNDIENAQLEGIVDYLYKSCTLDLVKKTRKRRLPS